MNDTVEKVSATPLELARLKSASEEYRVHKSIYKDPVTDEELPGFQTWPVFRDEFLEDWKSNRRVVTEKEADVHFDRIADESLNELETIGTPDVAALVDEVEKTEQEETIGVIVADPTTGEPVAVAVATEAPKRRGRPPGSGKKKAVVPGSRSYLRNTEKVLRKVAKKAAAKKKGGSTSERAQAIIEKYGPSGRKWSRKDVIEKLVSSIDGLGSAYASTLYQKFA